MLKIAVCDDDMFTTSQVESMIETICEKKGIKVETEPFGDGTTLWQAICNGEHYDLIYLDVEMESMDGITVAKKIREEDNNVLFIFISGYESYCKAILEVEPFRFLDKPIDAVKFEEFFLKANDKITDINRCFAFHQHSTYHRIPYKDILYFESNKRVITLRTNRTEYHFYAKMNDVEEKVCNNNRFFIRIHRSYLVNFLQMETFGKLQVRLLNEQVLPISVDAREGARKRYLELLAEE
ncbi:MAG: LytTR family DNA-binding domain-containing protein [Lachnospiraceae bacterium]|nr:LytTR family DNA-binding domain-containing protein [Lachnospiraceae bacterium]